MILCGGEISIDWDSDDASSWKTISSASASTVDYWTQKKVSQFHKIENNSRQMRELFMNIVRVFGHRP